MYKVIHFNYDGLTSIISKINMQCSGCRNHDLALSQAEIVKQFMS
jgi:hypothetical protein